MIKILPKKINDRDIYIIGYKSQKEIINFIISDKLIKPVSLGIIENNFINNINDYSDFLKTLLSNQVNNIAIYGTHSKLIEDRIDNLIVEENLESSNKTIMTTSWDNLDEFLEYTILSVSFNKSGDYESCVILIFPGEIKMTQIQQKINLLFR